MLMETMHMFFQAGAILCIMITCLIMAFIEIHGVGICPLAVDGDTMVMDGLIMDIGILGAIMEDGTTTHLTIMEVDIMQVMGAME